MSPAKIIILGFLAVIFVGGLLLMLPISSAERIFTSPSTAFFTATSATCVTGLIVRDTSVYWSDFGKGIILLLIQIGGLGFMSMAMLFSMLLGRRVSPKERIVFVQSMNLFSGEKMFRFIRSMIGFTFAFEGIGAVLLAVKFVPVFGFWNGLSKSIFHSISAFCNAGFDIMGSFSGEYSSLAHFAGDIYINIVVGTLIVCGGLGFIVWHDIYKRIREKKTLSPYSKLVLGISGALILTGTLFFLVSEWSNPDTIGASSAGGKLLRSLFMSVTCRTAGFSTISVGGLEEVSKVFSMMLMFIGGSSGSTAGGIKTVTIGVVLIAVLQIARGNRDINIRKRRLDNNIVSRAFALIIIAGVVVTVSSFILSFTEKGMSYGDIIFEAFSAFGTVGLSTGITPFISGAGRMVIMALMFFGRIGIITITYAIMMGLNSDRQIVRYPKTNVLLG
jgi:trk system potassium uptake protein TrkH